MGASFASLPLVNGPVEQFFDAAVRAVVFLRETWFILHEELRDRLAACEEVLVLKLWCFDAIVASQVSVLHIWCLVVRVKPNFHLFCLILCCR